MSSKKKKKDWSLSDKWWPNLPDVTLQVKKTKNQEGNEEVSRNRDTLAGKKQCSSRSVL